VTKLVESLCLAAIHTSLPLDAQERFEPGHLSSQVRLIRRVDHLADILVGARGFFSDSAE
jgi:hypothetical protein